VKKGAFMRTRTQKFAAVLFLLTAFDSALVAGQGYTVSQGDKEHFADKARERFGVDGSGVMVGVLSNAYGCANRLNLIQSGDLPPDVNILLDPYTPNFEWYPANGYYRSTEKPIGQGCGMVEVIHDLAPGATIAFHTSDRGEEDMANGIRALANAGATVIVDDTTYLSEPVYQEGGPITDAVREVIARGVTYISAAGNFGRRTYESAFRPSGIIRDIGGRTVELHDFDPGPGVDTCQSYVVPDTSGSAEWYVDLALHWDQPYASIGGSGATTDLDLFLMDQTCQNVMEWLDYEYDPQTAVKGLGIADNVGGDPYEDMKMYVKTGPKTGITQLGIAIGRVAGENPSRVRLTYAYLEKEVEAQTYYDIYLQDNYLGPTEYVSEGGTLFGHAALPEVITVGAVETRFPLKDPTTTFDVGGNAAEFFSALGGNEIRKPDIAGIDGIASSAVEGFWHEETHTTGFFYGTAAAAAHVAGIVALARQAIPSATPAQIAEALRATARDLDDTLTPGFDTGFDPATGYGLADAENLIARLTAQPETPRAENGDPKTATGCSNPTATLTPGAIFKGTPGNDIIQGANGNETIKGKAGNDVICGGPGNDKLSGGAGADIFRFVGTGTGQDKILDYQRRDSIEILGRSAYIRNTPNGALIRFQDGSADSILVKGVKAKKVNLRIQP
jgi:hypothetical protein